jgi:hypothetical protein
MAPKSKRNAFVPDGAAPLVTSFQLVGLHGYKNIRLDFQGQAKIVIAENGAGKTNFLSALEAFLTRNFFKLSNLQFDRVECELAGQSTPLILHRSQLPKATDEAQGSLRELAAYAGVDANDVRELIFKYNGEEIREVPIFNRVWLTSPWSIEEVKDRIRRLQIGLDHAQSDDVKRIASTLKTTLGATEVLYLPTYRRIELSISKRENRRLASQVARLRGVQPFEKELAEPQSPLGVNYGLADVEGAVAASHRIYPAPIQYGLSRDQRRNH